MCKWPQKVVSVLLAVMMVWAVVPGFGMAENVAVTGTTPSDLPEVTAKPTEVPTEVPTEEPTQVPTEEPPVLVEEVEQPPMLMAAARKELVTGLYTEDENAKYEVSGGMVFLHEGRFTANGLEINELYVTGATLDVVGTNNTVSSLFHVYSGGTVNMTAGSAMNGLIEVLGANFTDGGGCSYRAVLYGPPKTVNSSVAYLTAGSGVTIASGVHINKLKADASGNGAVTMAEGTSAGDVELFSGTLNAAGASIGTLTGRYGTVNGGTVGTLVIGSYFGACTTNGTQISALSFTDENKFLSIATEIATRNIPLQIGGHAPETVRYPQNAGEAMTITYGGATVSGLSPDIYFEFTRTGEETIPAVETYTYMATCHLGDGNTKVCNVQVPVQKRQLTVTVQPLSVLVGKEVVFISPDVEYVGLAEGHMIMSSKSNIFKMDGTEVDPMGTLDSIGNYRYVISNLEIGDANGDDVTSEYAVTINDGIVTVKEPTFTVTIPAKVDATSNMDISCDYFGYDSLGVTISSKDWMLKNSETGDFILYELTNAGDRASNQYSISFSSHDTKTLGFDVQPTDILPAGEYTDTLTFTVNATK